MFGGEPLKGILLFLIGISGGITVGSAIAAFLHYLNLCKSCADY